MGTKELCMNLLHAESEKKVIRVLKEAGYWDDLDSWVDYGNEPMNFSQIGNQQSLPEAALVEKLINSVDAMLTCKCILEGMDPEDRSVVPRTIQQATERFFGVRRGDLSKLTASQRTILAENIALIATGKKKKPNYTIVDRGEGQTPNAFPYTLVSLNRQNKVKIPFVQGKFNMGSTGVLQFCGKDNLQLIVSRKHPRIAEGLEDDSKDQWGFTIVRRVRPTGAMKNSVYKYLAPDGAVLRFEADTFPALPGDESKPYDTPIEWGTIIKLYEYELSGGLTTNVLFDLNYRLSVLMPEVALPIRLYEQRRYRGHTLEGTLAGLVVRLKQDRSEKMEPGFPTSASVTVRGEKMPCEIYAFKRDATKRGIKTEGILYVVNGQTHGSTHKRFYTRKKVGMSYLKDSIFVIVDCSNLSKAAIEDLFMNSRDRLRDIPLRGDIEEKLEKMIHDHPGLRALKESRRRERISDQLGDSKPFQEILESMLKRSSTLSQLLRHGALLHTPFNLTGTSVSQDYEGETFPSYFDLRNKNRKRCPLDRHFKKIYDTDACNDYLTRADYPGEFTLFLNGDEYESYSMSLWNGTGTLTVNLPSGVKPGEILHFSTRVSDSLGEDRFSSEFDVEIQEPAKKPSKKGGKRAPGSGSDGRRIKRKEMKLELPHIEEVYKKDWDEHGFNEHSALVVQQAGDDEYDFYVNMDNEWLLSEIKTRFRDEPEILNAQFEYGMALIGIGMLMESKTGNESEMNESHVLELIPRVSTALAPVIIPMIRELGVLVEEES